MLSDTERVPDVVLNPDNRTTESLLPTSRSREDIFFSHNHLDQEAEDVSPNSSTDDLKPSIAAIESISLVSNTERIDQSNRIIEVHQHESTCSVLKKLLRHTTPITIDNLIVAFADFGTAIIIKKIGSDAVGANGYILTVKNLFLFPTSAIFYSLQPILSRKFSEDKKDKFSLVSISSLLLVLPISLASAIVLSFIGPILKLFGQDPTWADITAKYFRYYIGSLPASLIMQNLLQIFLSTDNQNLLIPTSLLRTALDLGLGFMFVYGFKMGLDGWGLATLLQPWISLVLIIAGLKILGQFDLFKFIKLSSFQQGITNQFFEIYKVQKKILRLGAPIGGQIFVELGSRFVNVMLIGKDSKPAVVAYNISGQWTYWIVNLHASISTSAAVLCSNYISKNMPVETKKVKLLSLGVGLGISLTALLIYSVFSEPLTLALLGNSSERDEVLDYSRIMLTISSLSTLGFGFKYISSGISRGYKKTMVPMILDLVGSSAIGLTLAIIFTFAFNLGPNWVTIAELIGATFAACSTTIYAYKLKQDDIFIDRRDNYQQEILSGQRNSEATLAEHTILASSRHSSDTRTVEQGNQEDAALSFFNPARSIYSLLSPPRPSTVSQTKTVETKYGLK